MTTQQIAEIVEKREYFKEITWRHLSNCLKSLEAREYMSAAIWSAVFVESILKDYLRDFGEKSKDRDELDSLIKRVANYLRNAPDVSDEEKDKLNDILRRSEEIRSKRNRLVHDTGVENHGLETDVNDMENNVKQIINAYLGTWVSRAIYAENTKDIAPAAVAGEEPDFPVFVSTITPHNFEQTEFIEGFCNRLREAGIKPVRCVLTEFDKRDPMNKVRRIIENCYATVVIGLERSHVYYLRDKEGSEKEQEDMHRRYTSAWLQLESGMTIGMGKMVFVLCQRDLYGGGIFDREWNTFVPMELNLPLSIYDKNVDMILEKLKEYKEECQRAAR